MSQQSIGIIGAGWLGFPLAIQLKSLGYQVLATTRTQKKHNEFLEKGITHFSYEIGQTPPSPLGEINTLVIAIPSKDIQGFQKFVDWSKETAVKQIVFVSSTSVYLSQNQEVFENSPLQDSPLKKIEDIFLQSTNFQSTILRFGGLFGPNRHPARFFRKTHLVKQASAPVNLIHQADCIRIIETIIQRGIWGEIFNACADTHPTKKKFYDCAAQSISLELNFSDESGAYKTINSNKLKTHLHYRFKYADLMKVFDEPTVFEA